MTGEQCRAPGPGSRGYSVLGAHVDKYAVQYRFSYVPAGMVPLSLQKISRDAASGRKRISNKELVLAMFKNGLILGTHPSRKMIISKMDPTHHVHFEFGYATASIEGETLNFAAFEDNFSAIKTKLEEAFSLFDKKPHKMVASVRIGRAAAFRHHVLKAYGNQCCLCSDSLMDLFGTHETEAAHIVPKRLHGSDDVRNGLALCRKHHWAYDRGLFGIEKNYSVVIPDKVSAIPENASLARYQGAPVRVPQANMAADHSALQWHRENILSD